MGRPLKWVFRVPTLVGFFLSSPQKVKKKRPTKVGTLNAHFQPPGQVEHHVATLERRLCAISGTIRRGISIAALM